MQENRKHPRKSLELPAAFGLGGARIEGSCRDISIGGMFLETDAPAAYGSEIVVYLELPGMSAEAELRATVRWVKKGQGMGVQFGVMGARETHALIELLQHG